MWGPQPDRRKLYIAINSFRCADTRKIVFQRLAAELDGDRSTTYDLCSAMSKLTIRDNAVRSTLGVTPSFSLTNLVMKPISDYVDAIVQHRIQLCYGFFMSLTGRVLSHDEVDSMVTFCRTSAPDVWRAVMDMLGYSNAFLKRDQEEMVIQKQHLRKTYERTTFYEIISLSRVRKNHLFPFFSCIGAAATYANSTSETSRRISTFFGHICSPTTLTNKCKAFANLDDLFRNIHLSLSTQLVRYRDEASHGEPVVVYFFIGVFDNAQKNIPFKFQRFGATSNFVKVTARMFLQLWQGPWHDIVLPNKKVPLTYVDQAIPSPICMPPFELLSCPTETLLLGESIRSCLDHFVHAASPNSTAPLIDFSGLRVWGYLRHVEIASELARQKVFLSIYKPYAFAPIPFVDARVRMVDVLISLNSLRGRGGGLYARASTFQAEAVEYIRGSRPKAEIMSLPVVKDDETTIKGMVNVILKFLQCGGLLQLTADGTFVNPPDLGKRNMALYGDGLTCERFRNCKDQLLERQATFNKHYEQISAVMRAVDRVIMMPGDLHGGGFHTLGPVYTVFYGGFIQVFQIALGYKRIDASKVEKSYEQSSLLLLRVLRECERHMYDAYICQVEKDHLALVRRLVAEPAKLAEWLAIGLVQWIDDKLKSSKDDLFRFGLNFVKMGRLYRSFRYAIRCGDAIHIEHLWSTFSGIWLLLGKRIYTEISLQQMEDLYGKADSWMLQILRDNRAARLHGGTNKYGKPFAHRAIDDHMEDCQWRYKA